jgi:ankyrin repeat protein
MAQCESGNRLNTITVALSADAGEHDMTNKLKRWGDGHSFPKEFGNDHSRFLWNMQHGKTQLIRDFLTKEPVWLEYYYYGYSLLHIVAEHDIPDTLVALIDMGVDVNTPQEHYPWGAINVTVLKGYLASTRCLLEHGAKMTYEYDGAIYSCMSTWAAESGNFEMVKLLVEFGHPLDVRLDGSQHSLLTEALNGGHTELADYLRSKGALTDEEIIARDKKTKPKRKKK